MNDYAEGAEDHAVIRRVKTTQHLTETYPAASPSLPGARSEPFLTAADRYGMDLCRSKAPQQLDSV